MRAVWEPARTCPATSANLGAWPFSRAAIRHPPPATFVDGGFVDGSYNGTSPYIKYRSQAAGSLRTLPAAPLSTKRIERLSRTSPAYSCFPYRYPKPTTMKNQMPYGLSVLAGAMLAGTIMAGAIMTGWRPVEPWHPKAHRRNASRRRLTAPEAAAPEAMAGPSARIGGNLVSRFPGKVMCGNASVRGSWVRVRWEW